MNNNKLKLIATIFSILLCVTVFAQPPGGHGGRGGRGGGQGQQRGGKPDASKILSMLDSNNDSKISKSEAAKDRRGKISEDFDIIDANKDEFIDLEELTASLNNIKSDRKPKKISAEKVLKEVDDNGDGKLNELEVAAKDNRQLLQNFSEIDTNKDSEIDLEELNAFYSKKDKKQRRKRN